MVLSGCLSEYSLLSSREVEVESRSQNNTSRTSVSFNDYKWDRVSWIMKYYQDNHATIYNGDCRSMTELPDESVQCVVTSPPYWGLRKYSGEQELIWGDKECEHRWGIADTKEMNYVQGNPEFARPHREQKNFTATTNTCSLCGAWKGAYGLEPTPEMYIQHTVEIMREIRRVLRKDGVVFWNIGDSYWGGKGQSGQGSPEYQSMRQDVSLNKPYHQIAGDKQTRPSDGSHNILKPKDLCLIPFRVAIALQEDKWWVRSDIIWSKPNPMPESVTDRPTNSHEYIFLLTKSSKYYWDADAVREPQSPTTHSKGNNPRTTDRFADKSQGSHKDWHEYTPETDMGGRNIRSVWEFPTQPYPEAHFAVFPEKLPEICIKAGTPEEGCCSKCGKPWVRMTERVDKGWDGSKYGENAVAASGGAKSGGTAQSTLGSSHGQLVGSQQTLGWQPTCKCNADKVPSLVLDPFSGSGTVLWVAKKLNRRVVGYELSKEYCELALDRNRQGVLGI